jgi:spore maturation protein SpmB
MSTQVLDEPGFVTLDASGNGTVTLAPESFRTWQVTTINVRTDQGPTQVPVPQCTVYLGSIGDGQIKAQTWMGNRSTAVGNILVQPSQPLIIQWTNGVPGSVATVSLYGTMSMR